MRLILASKSPRRKQILEEAGFGIEVDVSNADEDSIKEEDIKKQVIATARLKAETVAKRHPNSIIIAADTLVYFEGERIGQQKTDEEAFKIMKKLLGKTHEVHSGICIINTSNKKIIEGYDFSYVTLKKVSEDLLKKYIFGGHYKGKAGAYNIADPEFESFIAKVEGCKYNVMGLPIEKVKKMIKEVK